MRRRSIFQVFRAAYPATGQGELPGSFEWTDDERWVFRLNGEDVRTPWSGHENAELRELALEGGWPIDVGGLPEIFRVRVTCHHSHKSRPPQYTMTLLTRPPWKRSSSSMPPALDGEERIKWEEHRAWLTAELDPLFDGPDDPIRQERAHTLMGAMGVVSWWLETRRPFSERDREQMERMDQTLMKRRRCRAGGCECEVTCMEGRLFAESSQGRIS